jgi:beta-galactosidase
VTDPTDAPEATDAVETTTPRVGVCYFPEHWPRERWATDAAQMADAGLAVVRLAEFSWSRLEPTRGAFDFEWLDDAVETLGDAGLDVVLCTPTATPPKWLVDEHPGILQEEPDATVRGFGSRRHYCFNSATYREETARIVERMADRYAGNPHVVGWQTDNEYGVHDTIRCYCDDCARAFREWLADRYGTVDALNEAWGTTFWSQRYHSFEAVDPPRHTAAEHHPSRLLDYARFSNDSVVDYNHLQARILREADDGGHDGTDADGGPDSEGWFVTHNFMGDFGTLDAHAVGEDLDFSTWDSYPTGFVQDRREGEATAAELRTGDPDEVSMNHDRYGAPFWVMEQQPGDVNWPPYAPQPAEGAMALWAHQAVAHGANAVLYFRWRRCREGQEQYHAGLRRHDGSADRGYADAERAAAAFDDLDLAPPDRRVALLDDFEHEWALSAQPHAPDFDYWTHARTYYRALRARGVDVDVVHPDADLSGYAAVVAPTLYLVDDALATRLSAYVESGGHLLATIRSGVKTPANQLRETLAPGPLTDLVGATVDRHESLPDTLDTQVTYRGDTYDFRTFGEWLSVDDATVRGRHDSGVADGAPAIVDREVGDGSVAYCGVWPEAGLADAVATDLLDRADVAYADRLPDTVRFAHRDGHTWVLNFGLDPISVDAPDDATWTLGGPTVEPAGVAVVDAPAASLSVDQE